jgi:hypothetical protein
MSVSKREVLLALAALGAGAALPAAAQPVAPDLSAGRAIGQAYLTANPNIDLPALRHALLPEGFGLETAPRLRARAAEDFRNARIFIFKGWRISETEALLFALLA